MYKIGVYFVWKKRLFLISKYFSELSWIYNVDIDYCDSCVKVGGDVEDVDCCLLMIESLLMGYKKGGKNEKCV